jgi:hypothetical protein
MSKKAAWGVGGERDQWEMMEKTVFLLGGIDWRISVNPPTIEHYLIF